MPRLRWTEKERAEAVRLYEQVGPAEASRRTGIPLGTVKSLASRAGVATGCIPSLVAATTVASLTLRDRRQRFAVALQDQAEKFLDHLWAPSTAFHWGTVSTQDGEVTTTRTEFMQHTLERPTYGDQKAIMSTICMAVDRSMKLTGDEAGPVGANILVQIQQRLAGGLDAETRVQVAALLDTIEAPPEHTA
jgi:hypothetical protein